MRQKKKIKEKLHIAVPEFYYIPAGMKYSKYIVFEETQMAVINISIMSILYIFIWQQMKRFVTRQLERQRKGSSRNTLMKRLDVEMGTYLENDEENYYALWKYKDAYYQLSGQIEKRRKLVKIINEMQYNV